MGQLDREPIAGSRALVFAEAGNAAAAGPPPGRGSEWEDADFAVVLLQALTNMAARSKRRQADLTAALRGADIAADPARVRTALKMLRAQGAIENLVPLSDGGLLLSVTQKATERPGPLPQWLPLDELDATAG
jgi:hypothetical protein